MCKCGALLYSMLDNIDNLYRSYYDGDDFILTVEITPQLMNMKVRLKSPMNDAGDGKAS